MKIGTSQFLYLQILLITSAFVYFLEPDHILEMGVGLEIYLHHTEAA